MSTSSTSPLKTIYIVTQIQRYFEKPYDPVALASTLLLAEIGEPRCRQHEFYRKTSILGAFANPNQANYAAKAAVDGYEKTHLVYWTKVASYPAALVKGIAFMRDGRELLEVMVTETGYDEHQFGTGEGKSLA